MSASGTISLTGQLISFPFGGVTIGPLTLTSSAANGQIQELVLQSGANTITVPTAPAPKGMLIVLPSDNSATVTLKGVSGDTGLVLSDTGWCFIPFKSGSVPASFVLNSSATQTSKYTYIYFI